MSEQVTIENNKFDKGWDISGFPTTAETDTLLEIDFEQVSDRELDIIIQQLKANGVDIEGY